jgi:hypothetical protein
VLLFVMMTFFSALALDISVPALVLCLMAMAKWVVVEGLPDAFLEGKTA